MIEVSTILFTLLSEGFIALLIVISVLVFIMLKRKKKDKASAQKLVKQIKQQSKTRLGETGSFLNEKYRFEGNDLEKAVKSIDKAEKKFMQKLINVYLQRDSHGLEAMDACVAELIETYKELSPVMPDAEMLAEMSAADPAQIEELNNLRESNEKLAEELNITKETMGNMIAEFGNMFGGGKENRLEEGEVIDKVNETFDEKLPEDGELAESIEHVDETPIDKSDNSDVQLDELENETPATEGISDQEDLMEELSVEEIVEEVNEEEPEETREEERKKEEVKPVEVFDEGIDDLMDGIDLSDDS